MTDSLVLRYLGVAGWHLQSGPASLLIDPYFTRAPMWRVALTPLQPDRAVIAAHTPPAQWVLVTHPHYDHLADVPEVAQQTGAQVYASPQGCDLLAVLGLSPEQCYPIRHGDRLSPGPFSVEVFQTPHRVIFGRIPACGPLRPRLRPPLFARDYRLDQHFSFRISAAGISVLVLSGIDEEPALPADVVLVGADMPPDRLQAILQTARPRLVLPNHRDDMFRPLNRPERPSLRPTRRPAWPRRLDLAGWCRLVEALAPGVQASVPARGTPIVLKG